MSEPQNPCAKDCPYRSPTCHSECEPYLAYYESRVQASKKRVVDGRPIGVLSTRYERSQRRFHKAHHNNR